MEPKKTPTKSPQNREKESCYKEENMFNIVKTREVHGRAPHTLAMHMTMLLHAATYGPVVWLCTSAACLTMHFLDAFLLLFGLLKVH